MPSTENDAPDPVVDAWARGALVPREQMADVLREAARDMPWRLAWTRGEVQGWLLERADRMDTRVIPPGWNPTPPEGGYTAEDF